MSFFGLTIAGSALDASQVAANVTSNDIANVNTPGASRQVVNLEPSPEIAAPAFITNFGPGTLGSGVTVESIQRIHQNSYDSLFRGASSSQNYFTIEQQQLSATQAQLGEPNNGINTALTNFETSIQQLAANPSDSPTRQNVIQQAQALVNVLNSSGQALQTQQQQVRQQAGSIVDTVNNILDQIAGLNAQIRASTAVGDNPNTYQDQRDYLIDQLSQYLATQTSVQANGSVLVTVGGQALVNDTVAYHIASPVIGTDSSGNAIMKIGFQNDPNPSNPVEIPLGSGQLAAYVDLYNNKLQPYMNQLNNFTASLANEVDRVTEGGLDENGNAGAALFQPIAAGSAIAAGNIQVGITDPSQVVAALASTAAGSLVSAANSSNNTIDTSALIDGNVTLNNPPATPSGIQGYLTISVDGIKPSISTVTSADVQTFYYNTAPGGNADTIDDFIRNFNNGHYGVDASWDASSQTIVFSRDPTNVDLYHRALQGTLATTASFTITDNAFVGPVGTGGIYNGVSADYVQVSPNNTALASGATNTQSGILISLAAASISGVAQNSFDAFGSGDNSGATALQSIFNQPLGVGYLQTTSSVGVSAAQIASGQPVTILPPAGDPNAFAQVQVGQLLTVDAQPNPQNLQPPPQPQENVEVLSVNRTTGAITALFKYQHNAGFSITTAQSQTLGQAYGSLTTQVGLDTQTAITGESAQTTLANNINQVRQSIDGINLDEETQNLIKFQNAYQAAAQTMNVLEQLLGTIITMASDI